MTKILTIMVCLLCTTSSFARKKVYYDARGNLVEKKHAYSYETVSKTKDNLFFAEEFYMNKTLRSSGYYETKKLKKKEGEHVQYNIEGVLKSYILYKNNKKTLERRYYNSGNLHVERTFEKGKFAKITAYYDSSTPGKRGSLHSVDNFEHGKPVGSVSYYKAEVGDTLGAVQSKSTFENGKIVGVNRFYPSGNKHRVDTYIDRKPSNVQFYYETGALKEDVFYTEQEEKRLMFVHSYYRSGSKKREETYVISGSYYGGIQYKKLNEGCFHEDGSVMEWTPYFRDVTYPNGKVGLTTKIYSSLHIPDYLTEEKLNGVIIVSYSVGIDGKITGIRLNKGVHNELDQQVLEQVERLQYVQPKIQYGEPITTHDEIQVRVVTR